MNREVKIIDWIFNKENALAFAKIIHVRDITKLHVVYLTSEGWTPGPIKFNPYDFHGNENPMEEFIENVFERYFIQNERYPYFRFYRGK